MANTGEDTDSLWSRQFSPIYLLSALSKHAQESSPKYAQSSDGLPGSVTRLYAVWRTVRHGQVPGPLSSWLDFFDGPIRIGMTLLTTNRIAEPDVFWRRSLRPVV